MRHITRVGEPPTKTLANSHNFLRTNLTMGKIQDFRKFFNHLSKRRLRRLKSLSLSITTSKGKSSFEVAIKVCHNNRIIHQDFRVLYPAEAQSESRAYWAGY